MSRRQNAIEAIRQAVAAASEIPLDQIGADDDLIDDVSLDELELESVGLILEEIFEGISVDPIRLFAGPLYRSIDSLADWCIRQADLAAEIELSRQRKRA